MNTIPRMPYSHDEIYSAAQLRADLPLLPLPKDAPPPCLLDDYDEMRRQGWSRKAAATLANTQYRAAA